MFALPLADPGVPETRSAGRFLLWVARRQARTLATGSLFGTVWMVSQALIPLALGAGLGAVVRKDKGALIVWAMVVLALGLVQAAAGILRHRRAVANFLICASRVQQLVTRRAVVLGGDLSRRVATGEVANIGASDIERLGDALDVVARFTGGIVAYSVVAAVLLVASPPLGAIVVLGVPVAVLAVAPLLKPLERRQTAERDRRTGASSIASDTVTGLRVLRGLGGEQVFANRYEHASRGVAGAAISTANYQSILDGAQVLLPGAIVVAVTWVGAHLAVGGTISAGELVAFYASAAFLVVPMQTFVEAASKWTAAAVAARRILGVLTLEVGATEGTGAGPPEPRDGQLLDEVTGLVVEPGRLTAVVAATPEEGTELLERLARWTTQSADTVTWGGVPVDAFPLDWYRGHVLMLERTPFHLKGPVREALDVPDPVPSAAGRPTLEEALDAAQAVDVLESLSDGLDSELPEQWRSLSGGQRQRLSLVQALLGGADVLLLDDPTCAVDAHTEAAIASGLARVRRGRTTVMTTTSPLMTERADVVVVVDGVVRCAGRAADLADDPLYGALVLRHVPGEGTPR